jgi:hypothetical protein
MHCRYLSAARASAYAFGRRMSTTDSPQPPERRDIRYPLHLPVSLKVADKKMHTRSENISLGGILLSDYESFCLVAWFREQSVNG